MMLSAAITLFVGVGLLQPQLSVAGGRYSKDLDLGDYCKYDSQCGECLTW